MGNLSLIPRIRQLFRQNGNILEFLRSTNGTTGNSVDDILISYDFQAGSYVKFAEENPEYVEKYSNIIAAELNSLGSISSLIEVGVGEGTTLANVVARLHRRPNQVFGFDISWSRILKANEYCRTRSVSAELFIGDLFSIPLADNSVDVVYTSHSLEPNGGREVDALKELFRIARRYIVLFEPSNEIADQEGRDRMIRNGYIQNLRAHIGALGYSLRRFYAVDVVANHLNPTAAYVIEKTNLDLPLGERVQFCCPISKGVLLEQTDHFYSADSLISYPKIGGIPCLFSGYGVLTTKHADL